ncbi:MAG TPA: host attachment protein [Caulobacteraceae bacterium]|nr:host attachment protein [Caulobacteraceae bacterium]
MPHQRKLIYVLADGAHARFVERAADTGAFVTVQRMNGEARLDVIRAEERNEQPGRTFESATTGSHGVGRSDAYRRAKESFIADVGRTLGEVLERRPVEGVVLAAPSRLLKPLRSSLPPRTVVVAEIGKDLIKTPDHELETWLGPLPLAARQA